MFCDYISAYQDHPFEVPKLTGGRVIKLTAGDTEIDWQTSSSVPLGDSASGVVHVRSDGNRVTVRGNVGKFGRPDNVANYDVDRTKQKTNELLRAIGLPEFTNGRHLEIGQAKQGTDRMKFSGAVVTRIDATENFAAGSPEDAESMHSWLAARQHGRLQTRVYGSDTVEIGAGSRYVYQKIYQKAAELKAHLKKNGENDEYLNRLINYLESVGCLRYEASFKSNFLGRKGKRDWALCTHESILEEFQDYKARAMRTNEKNHKSEKLKMTRGAEDMLNRYRNGENTKESCSLKTWYKYRRELLKHGIDLAVRCRNPNEVVELKTKVIVLEPLVFPDWYQGFGCDAEKQAIESLGEMVRNELLQTGQVH